MAFDSSSSAWPKYWGIVFLHIFLDICKHILFGWLLVSDYLFLRSMQRYGYNYDTVQCPSNFHNYLNKYLIFVTFLEFWNLIMTRRRNTFHVLPWNPNLIAPRRKHYGPFLGMRVVYPIGCRESCLHWKLNQWIIIKGTETSTPFTPEVGLLWPSSLLLKVQKGPLEV